MRTASLSSHLRGVQDDLNRINDDLDAIRQIARHRNLAPFRIAHIDAALSDNSHAWQELGELATTLELTGPPTPMPPCNLSTPHKE